MTAPLRAAFATQAQSCAALGSPFMARLMALFAARVTPDMSAMIRTLHEQEGDVGPSGASLPLRVAGGLHALVLRGAAPDLAEVYPPHVACDDALWGQVCAALAAHDAWFQTWIQSPPQTNEVRRSAVIRAAGQWAAARWGHPLSLLELGASAGLNLHWDAYGLTARGTYHGPARAAVQLAPDWRGALPAPVKPEVVARRGVDLAPPDLARPEDRLRLLAYLWPDQPERLERTRAALALPAAPVDAGDAGAWVEAALNGPLPRETTTMIFHTVAWQYFPQATKLRARAAIEAAGARATQSTPLVWFAMENDESDTPGAALTLRSWPEDETLAAGRACFHGRWVDWALDAQSAGPR